MAHIYKLEATYEDGFVYTQNEDDKSLYEDGRNCFYDVVNKLLEPEHGKLVNWAVISNRGLRYDLNMKNLPDNARVILYREMERDLAMSLTGEVEGWKGNARVSKWVFGAQWNDVSGKNHKILEELELQETRQLI